MLKALCMPVLYRYKRKSLPNSKGWHMHRYDAAPQPSLLPVGLVGVSDHGDQVDIIINVPCCGDGKIDQETHDEYEEIADERFQAVRPDAELA